MAEKIEINRITNANLYLQGKSHLGKAEEINAPTLKFKQSDHKAIGLFGMMEFPSGLEKIEMKLKWNSLYKNIMKIAANPFEVQELQIRASADTYDSSGRKAQVPVTIFINAIFKDFPLGNYKQNDNVELENNLTVYYCKLELDGEEIMEVDVMANIYKVNGVDLFAKYRENLGI